MNIKKRQKKTSEPEKPFAEAVEQKETAYRCMEMWFANLGYHHNRCIQNGPRPVLILSNGISNTAVPFVVAAPMTSNAPARF